MDTCGICFFTYDGDARKPLVLPCSHSFCQECLQQLDTLSNRHCPCCRGSWQHIAVADLLFCRQLIPDKPSVSNKRVKLDVCEKHSVGMSLWCDSCKVQLCIKCQSDKHRECQCLLIKEKINLLETKFSDTLHTMKNIMQSTKKYVGKFADDTYAVNFIENALSTLKTDYKVYKEEFNTWANNVEKEVALLKTSGLTLIDESSIISLEQRLDSIQMPQKPETLLGQVATAYLATCEKTTADSTIPRFVENLKKLLISAAPTTSTNIDSERAGDDGQPNTLELKEGQEWTILDCDRAAAAIATLTNTSVRPSSITVRGLINWPIQNMRELLRVITKVHCFVRLYMINCFTEFHEHSRRKTEEMVKSLNSYTVRCHLVDVWGHFDPASVERLPETVKKIGLVLSSSRDMKVLDALQCRPMWKRDAEINIIIKQSFETHYWSLQWDITNMLKNNHPKLFLHFTNLNPEDVEWMMDIIGKITCNFKRPSLVCSLYLPGTTVSLDVVLGVLRDCNLKCDVYLPDTSAPEHSKEELEARFKKFDCNLVWQ